MSHPHTRQFDRDALEDRGLVDDDDTENMLTAPEGSCVGAQVGSRHTHPSSKTKGQ